MKLVSFVRAGAIGYGIHLGDAVLDLRLAASPAGEAVGATTLIDRLVTRIEKW